MEAGKRVVTRSIAKRSSSKVRHDRPVLAFGGGSTLRSSIEKTRFSVAITHAKKKMACATMHSRYRPMPGGVMAR